MKIERTKNAVSGTITGIFTRVLQLIFPFITRTIFIKTLGIEYLGLNSLFSSILQVLNLAELGVSSALVFSMYRPIAEDDSQKICQLMNLYRHYYRIIGGLILGLGLSLTPFLRRLIAGEIPSDINIYVIYYMNLAATVLSYWLFAYRNSLFTAHQRVDILNKINLIISFVIYMVQIFLLLLVRNYYIYLLINILSQISINIVTAYLSKKYYPDYMPVGNLSKKERRKIGQKVRDVFTARIGMVINLAADSLVISAYLGLELVAIYQNYYYILSSLMGFFDVFFAACLAGIGNSLVVNDEDDNRQLLYNLNHIVFAALSFCCPCLICIFQPFMRLWVGEQYILGFEYVILFAIYLFVQEAPRTMLSFKDAGGIWKEDRFRPLTTAMVNLVLNLILVKFIGLYGVLLSTIISFIMIAFPWLIININKCLFRIKVKKYLFRYMTYVTETIIVCIICSFLCNKLELQNIYLDIVCRLFVCTLVSTVLFLMLFGRLSETEYLFKKIQSFVKSKEH